jgi:hypothetical protein
MDLLLDGGAGNDTIFGGEGVDQIFGGSGNDTIDGGSGNDTIDGGSGDDTIEGGYGNDTIHGGDGFDVLYGGKDNDTLYGGADDDQLFGGDNNDELYGGTGNDTLTGGDGNDTMAGGDDRDTFYGAKGDDVDGNEGGDDQDTLILVKADVKEIVYDPLNNENGTVIFNSGANLTFQNIENIDFVVCFTPGTSIATPRGEVLIEDLKAGDKVITRDNGIQEIRWVGHKKMEWKHFVAAPHLKPVLIRAGSLGNGLPERDMMVSPNHRMLVANDRTSLYFEEREVLVAAKHLINNQGIHLVDSIGTTYIHMLFDRHEVVLANGAWTESFQPGDYTLNSIGNAQRNEIFEIFPELRATEGQEKFHAARPTLKKHEARLLFWR